MRLIKISLFFLEFIAQQPSLINLISQFLFFSEISASKSNKKISLYFLLFESQQLRLMIDFQFSFSSKSQESNLMKLIF